MENKMTPHNQSGMLRAAKREAFEAAISRIFDRFGYDRLEEKPVWRTAEDIRADLRVTFLPETVG